MLIVVFGLPGTGKSYFAQSLSERLGAVYISSDKLRNEVKARGRYSLEDKLKIYEAMAEEARSSLRLGKDVVVDATFYKHVMISLFVRLAEVYAIPILFIKIEADEKLIKERLEKPRGDSEADLKVYAKIKEEFEEPAVPHLRLRSEADNLDSMLQSAISYTGKRHE
jgi:predicted kinase